MLTHFYWNEDWQCVEERVGGSGSANKQYVWHPYYIDALAVSFNYTTGAKHYYTHDANFNVTAAINASGTVVERYQYSPYGEATILDANFAPDSDNISDIGNEFLYTGRRLAPETGLYQFRHRYYHAQLGRFVNRDPVGYADGWNLYEYVGGSPLGWLDPWGLEGYQGYWHGVGEVFKGYGDAAVGTAEGLWFVARHPVQTAQGIGTAIRHPFRTGVIVGQEIAEKSGSLRGQGELVGDVLIGVATAGSVKAASKTKLVTEASQKARRALEGAGGTCAAAARNLYRYGKVPLGGIIIKEVRLSAIDLPNATNPGSHLRAGVDFETQQLAQLGLAKNTTIWRPTIEQTQSAAFKIIVGDPKYTKGGQLRGSILDATDGGLLEIKGGRSVLGSTYQLRLQIYRSLVEGQRYTIRTSRPINPSFADSLQRWGVTVERLE